MDRHEQMTDGDKSGDGTDDDDYVLQPLWSGQAAGLMVSAVSDRGSVTPGAARWRDLLAEQARIGLDTLSIH